MAETKLPERQVAMLEPYVYQHATLVGWWVTRNGPWRAGQPECIVASTTNEADARLVCEALNSYA